MSATLFDKMKKQMGSGRLSIKSIVALFLFGAIILVFVFFGLSSKTSGAGGSGYVARVNNTLISNAELRSESQRLEQMYAPLFGGQMSGDAQRQFVQGQALENLISMELISEAAHTEGILATDLEIRDFITKDVPIFQKDGRFQRDLYNQYLQYSKAGAGEFEDKIRKDRKNQRARRLFESRAIPLDLELQKQREMKAQKRNVLFVKIDKEAFLNSANLSSSEATTALAQPDFAKKAEEYFNANRSEFSKEAQMKASHILIKFQAGDSKSEAQAMEKIKAIQARLKNEDFAKVAKASSEDMGSKDKGGDLGSFGPGKMLPEFEKAVMEQKIGAVGEPVKTQFGYHLIKVTERRNAENPNFDQVKNQVAAKVMASEKLESATKALEEALTKSDSTAVEAQLKSLKLNWEETGYFDLAQDSIPKLGSPVVSQAAFEVSSAKPLLNRLVRDSGMKYVLKLKDVKNDTQAAQAFDTAKMSKDKSYELFSQWIESTKKSAKIERNLPTNRNRSEE